MYRKWTLSVLSLTVCVCLSSDLSVFSLVVWNNDIGYQCQMYKSHKISMSVELSVDYSIRFVWMCDAKLFLSATNLFNSNMVSWINEFPLNLHPRNLISNRFIRTWCVFFVVVLLFIIKVLLWSFNIENCQVSVAKLNFNLNLIRFGIGFMCSNHDWDSFPSTIWLIFTLSLSQTFFFCI